MLQIFFTLIIYLCISQISIYVFQTKKRRRKKDDLKKNNKIEDDLKQNRKRPHKKIKKNQTNLNQQHSAVQET
jgi:hypothetical protein